jgi:hypothetical protein
VAKDPTTAITLFRPNPMFMGFLVVSALVMSVFVILFALNGPPFADGALDTAIFGAIAGVMLSVLRLRIKGVGESLVIVNWLTDTKIPAEAVKAVSVDRGLVIVTADGFRHRTAASQPSVLGDVTNYPRAHRAASQIGAWIKSVSGSQDNAWRRTRTGWAVALPVSGAVLGAALFAVVRLLAGVG